MKPDAAVKSFTIAQASALSGLGVSMVDYLCRTDTVVPTAGVRRPGRGTPRAYSFGDVVILRAVAALLKCGVSVAKLRAGLKRLREKHPLITRSRLPAKFLVTDGRSIYFRDPDGMLEDLGSQGQMAFAFVVELQGIRDEVAAACRSRRLGSILSVRGTRR